MPGLKASDMTSGRKLIDAGVSKEFMIREWKQAKAETVTPNCRQRCSGCGAKRYGGGVCHEGQN